LEDSYSRLWISTNQGLSCFNPDSQKLRNFTIIESVLVNKDVSSWLYTESPTSPPIQIRLLESRNNKKKFYNQQNSDLPSNNIYSIMPDEGNGLWIASLIIILYQTIRLHIQF